MGCTSSIPGETKEPKKTAASPKSKDRSVSPSGGNQTILSHLKAKNNAHRKLAKKERKNTGKIKKNSSSKKSNSAQAKKGKTGTPAIAAAGGQIPACYGKPTLVPVGGRTVRVYGPYQGEMLVMFVPLRAKKPVVVHCPSDRIHNFIENMDRYAFPQHQQEPSPTTAAAAVRAMDNKNANGAAAATVEPVENKNQKNNKNKKANNAAAQKEKQKQLKESVTAAEKDKKKQKKSSKGSASRQVDVHVDALPPPAYSDLSCAQVPPPRYSGLVLTEDEDVSPTAPERSIPIKDDPRNYDMSAVSRLRPLDPAALNQAQQGGAYPAPTAPPMDETPYKNQRDGNYQMRNRNAMPDMWEAQPIPHSSNHFFLPSPCYPATVQRN